MAAVLDGVLMNAVWSRIARRPFDLTVCSISTGYRDKSLHLVQVGGLYGLNVKRQTKSMVVLVQSTRRSAEDCYSHCPHIMHLDSRS